MIWLLELANRSQPDNGFWTLFLFDPVNVGCPIR